MSYLLNAGAPVTAYFARPYDVAQLDAHPDAARVWGRTSPCSQSTPFTACLSSSTDRLSPTKGTPMLTSPAVSTQGLLTSLAAALPGASPLRRQAAHIARQLSRPHPRELDRKASDLLALLLDATDTPESAGYETDGVLDTQFDD